MDNTLTCSCVSLSLSPARVVHTKCRARNVNPVSICALGKWGAMIAVLLHGLKNLTQTHTSSIGASAVITATNRCQVQMGAICPTTSPVKGCEFRNTLYFLWGKHLILLSYKKPPHLPVSPSKAPSLNASGFSLLVPIKLVGGVLLHTGSTPPPSPPHPAWVQGSGSDPLLSEGLSFSSPPSLTHSGLLWNRTLTRS